MHLQRWALGALEMAAPGGLREKGLTPPSDQRLSPAAPLASAAHPCPDSPGQCLAGEAQLRRQADPAAQLTSHTWAGRAPPVGLGPGVGVWAPPAKPLGMGPWVSGEGELNPGSRAGRQAPSTPTLWALAWAPWRVRPAWGRGLRWGSPPTRRVDQHPLRLTAEGS